MEDHLCSDWFRGDSMKLDSFHQWIQKHIIKTSSSFWALRNGRIKQRMKSSNGTAWMKTTVSFWLGAELSELLLPLLLKHGHVWLCLNRASYLWCVFHCFKRAIEPCNNCWVCLVSSLVCKDITFWTRKLTFFSFSFLLFLFLLFFCQLGIGETQTGFLLSYFQFSLTRLTVNPRQILEELGMLLRAREATRFPCKWLGTLCCCAP